MKHEVLLAACLSVTGAAVVVSCGARTELLAPSPSDGSIDGTLDHTGDGPLFEGGKLDVVTDCPDSSTYCSPGDPGYLYACGERVFQCSSLEQCESGLCVNPCVDTLGQNTSNGCEYYIAEMDMTPEASGVCYAVFVVNQWSTGEPAKIQVDLGGTVLPISAFARIPSGKGTGTVYNAYDESMGLPTNEIAVLFLSRDPAAESDPNPISPRKLANCPPGVTPAVVGDASLHGTGTATAFHIKTNVPVVAYSMLPYGAGRARVTGATLMLPTNVWDTNYLAVDAYEQPTSFTEDRAGPTTMIFAEQDSTTVTIKPVVDIIAGGGLAGTSAGTSGTYTLNHGQYIQFTQPNALTGSAIQSSAPIAVIGGSTLMDVPLDQVRADSAHQQLPPIHALGHTYVAVRYRSRDTVIEEYSPYRVVGVVDGTTLTYEPSVPPGAPTSIDAGELVEFIPNTPFVVYSQDANHPFYMAQYMTGGEQWDGTGDPEFVNMVTPDQYLPRYTFFTDPTYPETNLVVVRVRDSMTSLFPDVTLDCAGVLTGWTDVGTSGTYQWTRVDLSTGDFMGVGGCDNGVHVITGSLATDSGTTVPKFGVTIWGWGNPVTWEPDEEDNPNFTRWVSYGYPAGADITQLNTVVMSAK
jgi:IgGFc binding protein